MTPKILDGKELAMQILNDSKKRIEINHITAKLVSLVGDSAASQKYTQMKEKTCKEIGIDFETVGLNETPTEEIIIKKISELNNRKDVTGIIVQLPLPKQYDSNKIINTISPKKDVDGLTKLNREALAGGDESLACCAPKGIIRLLERNKIELANKKIVLVGNGYLVGQPLVLMLRNRKVDFIICDNTTKDLQKVTKDADILITATGVPHLIKKEFVKEGAVVIDSGVAELGGNLVGDVDFEDVKDHTSFITPIKGGVGPMTIAILVENILNAAVE